ncbi:hypothetical protein PHLGIDRAFT_131367 [Phlebiopsis gigantea 11061_1 CR5-6]|uniref:cAMP-independent regulatory protein n=1 Tax=Phlebiopsis gigantea (strain 11061_1 CR5-6) TaxID=745531 RepID=A0A0C3RY99_PHLG1|nr:hypothetical protein PHLGIDRAFT_131367 [Phlebiopsis gigantea 11061_1 CR5-6]
MQQPTLAHVRVRSTRDALHIFYAVARGVLPMITRRLDAEERRAIVPGNVYIWEERCANAEITGLGMERWTDGISWSASRIAQEFLFYRQRDSDQDSNHPSAQWASIMKRRDPRGSAANPRSEVDRLIKQTYSVHVSLPADRDRGLTRKWHLTAYFSQATLDSLGTIDGIPTVGDVAVPSGWFKNARASKARQGDGPRDDDGSAPCQDPWAAVEPMTTTFRAQFSLDDVPQDDQRRWSSPSGAPAPAPRHEYSPPRHPTARGHPGVAVSHPGRLPAADTDVYRDPSPFTSQSSSTSSELDVSPRAFSAPATPPVPSPRHPSVQIAHQQQASDRNLVPLSFLTQIRQPVRDPIAEDCLRRLASTPRLDHRWSELRTTLPP